jgi:hypothetical protein
LFKQSFRLGGLKTWRTRIKGWTWRSLRKGGFTGHTVSFRDFNAIVTAWVACSLLERVAGFKEPLEFDPGDQLRVRGKASRFRATPKLLARRAAYGITPQNAGEHFAYRPPKHPLRLNASSTRVALWKEPGRPMKYRPTEETARLEAQVKELNAFMAQHRMALKRRSKFTYSRSRYAGSAKGIIRGT